MAPLKTVTNDTRILIISPEFSKNNEQVYIRSFNICNRPFPGLEKFFILSFHFMIYDVSSDVPVGLLILM